MANYALIDSNGVVQNIVVWDGVSPWTPPDGLTAVLNPETVCAGIGWTYESKAFVAPALVADPEAV